MKYKIVSILGARPQFVKAAVLSRIITDNNLIEEVIIHTGQHYDANMSAVFFDEMDIPKPKYNLQINGLSHGAMTGQMLERIEQILLIEKPDAVVVYGDTNSTLAGALAAKKLHIKLVHIEAGLRSYNMNMPEELNRIITDRIADLLLCPTDKAIANLKAEGFDKYPVIIKKSGDIMKDSVLYYQSFSKEKATIYQQLNLTENAYILATIHRQENTDDNERLKHIFEVLSEINTRIPVVMPLHPRTKKVLKKNDLHYDITFIDPVGYFDMLELLKNCTMVITDSGGLQKEAFFNKKPVIIARDETEWVELVVNGFAKIAGANKQKIYAAFEMYHKSKLDFSLNLYGTDVGKTIYNSIVDLLKNRAN